MKITFLANMKDISLSGKFSKKGFTKTYQMIIMPYNSFTLFNLDTQNGWRHLNIAYLITSCQYIMFGQKEFRKFPGGPVVQTEHFHHRGPGFDP